MTSTPGKARRPASLLPLLALLCLMPMAARPAAGAAEGLAIPSTALLVTPLNPPHVVRGDDGRDHLEYDLLVTNAFASPVTLSASGFWAWWHGTRARGGSDPRRGNSRACWSRRRSRPSPPLARRRLKSTWPSRRGGCRHAFRIALPTRCRTPRRTSWQSSAAARSGGRSWRSRLSRRCDPAAATLRRLLPSTAAARRTPTATSE